MRILILFTLILCLLAPAAAQTPVNVIWQITSFDINGNVQQNERSLSAVVTLDATNVGNGPGRTLTLRLNSKASVKGVTVGGAAANFRPGTEPRGDLQKLEVSLPASIAPNASVKVAVSYV